MTISQSDYYRQRGLHPVSLAGREDDALARFLDIRRNLYQTLLKMPLGWLAGRDVLEVGCGTGESALLLALLGAELTLVDSNPAVEAELRSLFHRFGVAERIRDLRICGIEALEDGREYALVTAEGFLFTLEDREAVLARLCGLVQPGGLGVISFPDRFGSFFEFLRKLLLWRTLQVAGIADPFSEEAFAVAERLHGDSYGRLPNARPFRVWWEDCLVSPFLTWRHCWDHESVLEVLDAAGCDHHTSIPDIDDPPPLAWYKETRSREERRQRVLETYRRRRRFELMLGHDLAAPLAEPDADVVATEVAGFLKACSAYFDGADDAVPGLDVEKIAPPLLRCGAPAPLIEDLGVLFGGLEGWSAEDLIAAYRRAEAVNSAWGKSYQFLCFIRDDAP